MSIKKKSMNLTGLELTLYALSGALSRLIIAAGNDSIRRQQKPNTTVYKFVYSIQPQPLTIYVLTQMLGALSLDK